MERVNQIGGEIACFNMSLFSQSPELTENAVPERGTDNQISKDDINSALFFNTLFYFILWINIRIHESKYKYSAQTNTQKPKDRPHSL